MRNSTFNNNSSISSKLNKWWCSVGKCPGLTGNVPVLGWFSRFLYRDIAITTTGGTTCNRTPKCWCNNYNNYHNSYRTYKHICNDTRWWSNEEEYNYKLNTNFTTTTSQTSYCIYCLAPHLNTVQKFFCGI